MVKILNKINKEAFSKVKNLFDIYKIAESRQKMQKTFY